MCTALTRLNTCGGVRAEGRVQQSPAGDPLLQRLRDGARLLVDFLEHEMPVLSALDGVGRQIAFAHRPRRRRAARRPRS